MVEINRTREPKIKVTCSSVAHPYCAARSMRYRCVCALPALGDLDAYLSAAIWPLFSSVDHRVRQNCGHADDQ
jgi:hypothetical protein